MSCGFKVELESEPVDINVNHEVSLNLDSITEFCNGTFEEKDQQELCVDDLLTKFKGFIDGFNTSGE